MRVLYLGRLTAAKNVRVIVDAIAMVISKGKRCELTVVGEGPEKTDLTNLVRARSLENSVHFTGGVSNTEATRWLKWTDVLVLVSETEGWPKAIAEGMAFGAVCIGSDRGIIPEMLSDGRGFVVPAGDSNALAQLLLQVSKTDDLAPMRDRARRWASHYSLERLREEIQRLLQQSWGASLGATPRPVSELKRI